MAQNISIKDEIYETLTKMKGERNSYSDVIEDLLKLRQVKSEVKKEIVTIIQDWGNQGRIVDPALKSFVGKKATVTINVDDGAEVTTMKTDQNKTIGA